MGAYSASTRHSSRRCWPTQRRCASEDGIVLERCSRFVTCYRTIHRCSLPIGAGTDWWTAAGVDPPASLDGGVPSRNGQRNGTESDVATSRNTICGAVRSHAPTEERSRLLRSGKGWRTIGYLSVLVGMDTAAGLVETGSDNGRFVVSTGNPRIPK